MEQLLSKVTDAGIDPSSVSGEEAITLWEHIGLHIASTNEIKRIAISLAPSIEERSNSSTTALVN